VHHDHCSPAKQTLQEYDLTPHAKGYWSRSAGALVAKSARDTVQALIALCMVASGCAPDPASHPASWTTTRTTVGDTNIVRTEGTTPGDGARTLVSELSIGVADGPEELMFSRIQHLRVASNGELWIFDTRLRVYDSTGKFIRHVGRRGTGPGEYEEATGIVILRDGRGILWDGNRSMLRIYSAEGEPTGDLRVPEAHSAGLVDYLHNTLHYDTAGNVYLRGRIGDDRYGLIKIALDGSRTDTLIPPTFGLKSWYASAYRDGGGTASTVDHMPEQMWTWGAMGYFVAARNDQYALHLVHPGGTITRIERMLNPVPFMDGEWEEQFGYLIPDLRRYEPNWEWTGPVPENRPYFDAIAVADDARLWVRVATVSSIIPDAERSTAVPQGGGAPIPIGTRFGSPVRYDVYSPDGEFLGRVSVPERTSLLSMKGNHVWARSLDADDVQTVTRFRIEPPLGTQTGR
jgi:hypothetical protein